MAKTQTILIFEQWIALPETSIAYSQMFNFNSNPPQTSRRMSETSWCFVFGMLKKSRDVLS